MAKKTKPVKPVKACVDVDYAKYLGSGENVLFYPMRKRTGGNAVVQLSDPHHYRVVPTAVRASLLDYCDRQRCLRVGCEEWAKIEGIKHALTELGLLPKPAKRKGKR